MVLYDAEVNTNRQTNTFYKSVSAHPSINNFQICWCHMTDNAFSQPFI